MEVMNMRIIMLPKTSLGWWSVGLAATFILSFVFVLVLSSKSVYAGESGRFWLVALIAIFAFGISALGSFVTGLISILKNKERSVLVFAVVVLLGLFILIALIFEIGEVVF